MGLIAFILVGVAVYRWMPVGKQVDPLVYFDEFKSNQNNLVYEDKRIPLKEPVTAINDTLYVSYEFVREYISDTVFYDSKEKVLTITDSREVLRLNEGETKGRLNFSEVTVKAPIKELKGICYLPVKLITEKFGITVVQGKDKRVYIADNQTQEKRTAVVKRKASLRTHAKSRTTVAELLKKGQKVTIYKEEAGFLRVRSENGIIGFIEKGDVKSIKEVAAKPLKEAEPIPVLNPINGKVKLVWDQMNSKTPGNWRTDKYANVKLANVISPTWFEFEDELGNLTDRGTREYILAAKRRNLQVWPLLSHNFSKPEFTKPVLSSTKKRQHVIDQIIRKSEEYGYEGINIDIENIQPEISDVWVQFMRELYPQLREMGLLVTVDVYMPSEWSNHYEREKIAKVCDYFIVMAYDQHWSGSEEAGSVSEIPWVEEGIQKNLKEVPKEKLVLGIPFYTRVWQDGAEGLKAESCGMKESKDIIKKWGIEPVYDEASGQKYAEIEKNNILYQMWIEDNTSIAKRIALLKKYNLAGYGAWKLGLETPDIWDELGKID